MVLRVCPPPLSVSSVPQEEHGIERPVPHPPGGPLVGPAQPPVHLPNQGESLLGVERPGAYHVAPCKDIHRVQEGCRLGYN